MAVPTFPALPGQDIKITRAPTMRSLRQKAISGRETFQPQWQYPLWKYELSFNLLTAAASSAWGGSEEFQTLAGFWNQVMATPGGLFQYSDPNDCAVAGQFVASGDGETTSFQLVRTLGGFTEPVLAPSPGVVTPTLFWDYGSAGSPDLPPGAPSDCGNCTGYTSNTPSLFDDYGNSTTVPDAAIDNGNCTSAPTTYIDNGTCSTFSATTTDDLGACGTMQVYVGTANVNWSLAPGGVVTVSPAPGEAAAITWTGAYAWLCRFDEDQLSFDNFLYQLFALKKCAFTTVRL